MSKINLFISYNHSDKDLLNILIEIINKKYSSQIDIKYDAEIQNNPQNLYGTISKLLNKSHIVLAIITKNWLNSNNTKDEFIRAHERRKYLYCLFKKDDSINEMDLPFYIKGNLRFEFDSTNFENTVETLLNSIINFKSFWKLDIMDNIRKIGDIIDDVENSDLNKSYLINHIINKLEDTLTEIKSANNENFTLNVSYENNFLELARPYFETASEIYAVSLASISTFWTDANTPNGIKKLYLNANKSDNKVVIRIFVFETPLELNNYKNVLQANYDSYGKNKGGSVIVCSKDNYNELIKNYFSDDESHLLNLSHNDFGILIYKDKSYSNSTIVKEALLSKGKMNIKNINLDEIQYESRKEFIKFIKSNEINKNGLYRWNNKYYQDKNEMSKLLELVFKTNSYNSEVFHTVLFSVNEKNENDFQNIIGEFQNYLIENKEKYHILSVSLKNIINYSNPIKNRVTGVTIKINSKYNYLFLVKFKTKEYLIKYYEDFIKHNDIRNRIYKLLNPKTIPIFRQIDELNINPMNEASIKELYEDIESAVIDEYANRFDWENNIPYDAISIRDGARFLGYGKPTKQGSEMKSKKSK